MSGIGIHHHNGPVAGAEAVRIHPELSAGVNLATLIANLRGPHPLHHVTAMGHDGFTDFAVSVPQAVAADPALGARLGAIFDTQVETEAEGTTCVPSAASSPPSWPAT